MSRLIDADKFIEEINTMWYDNDNVVELWEALPVVIKTVEQQPTAFDVDKVIEQLDELVTINMEVLGVRADYVNLAHVIKIVKAGGIDDNNK
jgi:hypothetical protein